MTPSGAAAEEQLNCLENNCLEALALPVCPSCVSLCSDCSLGLRSVSRGWGGCVPEKIMKAFPLMLEASLTMWAWETNYGLPQLHLTIATLRLRTSLWQTCEIPHVSLWGYRRAAFVIMSPFPGGSQSLMPCGHSLHGKEAFFNVDKAIANWLCLTETRVSFPQSIHVISSHRLLLGPFLYSSYRLICMIKFSFFQKLS